MLPLLSLSLCKVLTEKNTVQRGNKDNEPRMEGPLEQSHSRLEFNSLLYGEARAIRGGG